MYEGLEQEDLTGKLVLVQPLHSARHMAVRSIRLDGMFMDEKVNQVPIRRPGPLVGIAEMNAGGVVTNGGLISPQSESQKSMSTPPPTNGSPDNLKYIDPSKVRLPRSLRILQR